MSPHASSTPLCRQGNDDATLVRWRGWFSYHRVIRSATAREHFFPSRHGNQLTAAFKRAARWAVPEKPDLHFHSLRHGCCVFWLEKGVGVKDVRDLLRHKDIKTTMQYSQVVVKGQTDRFEAAYGRV